MGEIIIRKMQPEDLAEVCKIEKDNFSVNTQSPMNID